MGKGIGHRRPPSVQEFESRHVPLMLEKSAAIVKSEKESAPTSRQKRL